MVPSSPFPAHPQRTQNRLPLQREAAGVDKRSSLQQLEFLATSLIIVVHACSYHHLVLPTSTSLPPLFSRSLLIMSFFFLEPVVDYGNSVSGTAAIHTHTHACATCSTLGVLLLFFLCVCVIISDPISTHLSYLYFLTPFLSPFLSCLKFLLVLLLSSFN
jgi:hypothetical protein